jgi:HK97 family phage portal protein
MPSFIQRLGAATKAARLVFTHNGGSGYPGYGSNSLYGTLPGTQYKFEQEVGTLWSNSAVSICLGWMIDNFSEPEFQVTRKDGEGNEVAVPHALTDLIQEPNDDYDAETLWMATLLSYCVDGNAYWIKARGSEGFGRPLELWYVPHWMMAPAWPQDGSEYISHYVYTPNGMPRRIEKEDVVHFRFGMDPENQRLGMSRLKAVIREIFTDNEAGTYSAAIMKNMGIPGVLLNPKPIAGEEVVVDSTSRRELEVLWNSATTGDSRGKPVIPSVALDVVKLGLSPEELALDKIRQVPESRICGALRIPAMVVGLNVGHEQRTYSNYGEARESAYEDCLIPIQGRFARTLRRSLLPDLGDPSVDVPRWDYSRVRCLQEDEDARWKRVIGAKKERILTPNEARALIGFKPIEGGDELGQPEPPVKPEPEEEESERRLNANGNGRR